MTTTEDMVKAILDGRKTMTRRVMRPQPEPCWHHSPGQTTIYVPNEHGEFYCHSCGNGIHPIPSRSRNPHDVFGIICPYGKVGDRLYVRTHRFMPKVDATLWLEITDIRVERVQDISEEDCYAEGIALPHKQYEGVENSTRLLFQYLWESLNAKRGYSWKSNPFVWAITFKRA